MFINSFKIHFYSSYYIGNQINELNRKILKIRLPKLIRRNLRPLSEREHYKASEWKIILLFIAYPLLMNILPDRWEIILIHCNIAIILFNNKIDFKKFYCHFSWL